jgi:hypothetical protein
MILIRIHKDLICNYDFGRVIFRGKVIFLRNLASFLHCDIFIINTPGKSPLCYLITGQG